MIYHNWAEINELAVKAVGRPAVYISNNLDMSASDDEIFHFIINRAKVMFNEDKKMMFEVLSGLCSGGLFFFDDKQQAQDFYSIFTLPETDSSGMYACIHDASGKCINENT